MSEADPTEHDSVAATLLVRRNDGISVDSTEGCGTAVLYAFQRAGEWTGSKVTEIVEDTPSERHHRNVISAPEQALESARMERQERANLADTVPRGGGGGRGGRQRPCGWPRRV